MEYNKRYKMLQAFFKEEKQQHMITIDGSAKSGSGTIVRYSVALASLLAKEINLQLAFEYQQC